MTLTLNRPWSNVGTAHRVIITNILGKLFVNPTRGSKEKERTQNTVIQRLILNFDLDLQLTLVKHKHRLIIADICAKLFVNPTRGLKDIERTPNTVIQCLILNCDLDLDLTVVKHRHCTLSHHT